MLIDSHCHLDFPDFAAERDDIVARAKAAGVGRLITISTHVARFDTYRQIAEAYDNVWFTVGTHPHQAHEEPDITADRLVELARHPRCIGIGEAGLDYHYDRSPRDVAARVFRTHIAVSRQTGLPLIVPDTGGCAEVADRHASELYAARDAESAAAAIGRLFARDPALLRRAAAVAAMSARWPASRAADWTRHAPIPPSAAAGCRRRLPASTGRCRSAPHWRRCH